MRLRLRLRRELRHGRCPFGDGQYLKAGLGDEYRMLPLGGKRVVAGNDSPTIAELADFTAAGIDHRFDGENHARGELHTGRRSSVVQHLGFFMKFLAYAMTAELAHDAVALALRVSLDRVPHIA